MPTPRDPDQPVAAPPDDGGGLGSFTRPEDVLQYPGRERPRQNPPLQYHAPQPPEQRTGVGAAAVVVFGMVFAVVFLFIYFLLT